MEAVIAYLAARVSVDPEFDVTAYVLLWHGRREAK
jgi:hypothetical protein